MKIGDTVKCNCHGSWLDGRTGKITRLNVKSSDKKTNGENCASFVGHQLKFPECNVLVQPENLELVTTKD